MFTKILRKPGGHGLAYFASMAGAGGSLLLLNNRLQQVLFPGQIIIKSSDSCSVRLVPTVPAQATIITVIVLPGEVSIMGETLNVLLGLTDNRQCDHRGVVTVLWSTADSQVFGDELLGAESPSRVTLSAKDYRSPCSLLMYSEACACG